MAQGSARKMAVKRPLGWRCRVWAAGERGVEVGAGLEMPMGIARSSRCGGRRLWRGWDESD